MISTCVGCNDVFFVFKCVMVHSIVYRIQSPSRTKQKCGVLLREVSVYSVLVHVLVHECIAR